MTQTLQSAPEEITRPRHGRFFRAIAIAEAVSWAGLLIGMLFKYVLSDNEIGVRIFGPIHGTVFLAYVATVFVVRRPLRWSFAVTAAALVASIPPLFTWFFEVWARRTGRV
jgi:integral membrane protein